MNPQIVMGVGWAALVLLIALQFAPSEVVKSRLSVVLLYIALPCLIGAYGLRTWEAGNIPGVIGWISVILLVVLWHVVSLSAPGSRREALEWAATSCLYLALCMLFLGLVLRFLASGEIFFVIAFGFLGVIFVMGGCVSLFNLFRSLGSPGAKAQASATN